MVEAVPQNDLKEHVLGGMCHCWPDLIFDGDKEIVVIHSAYDGRTAVEDVNEILGNEHKADNKKWNIIKH